MTTHDGAYLDASPASVSHVDAVTSNDHP